MFKSPLHAGGLSRRTSARRSTSRAATAEMLEERAMLSADSGLDGITELAGISRPQAKNNTLFTDTSGEYTIQVADFGFSDPGDIPPDDFVEVSFQTIPLIGQLQLDGVEVAPFQVVSTTDIAAGKLKYVLTQQVTNSVLGSFQFLVVDSGTPGLNVSNPSNTIQFLYPTEDSNYVRALFQSILQREVQTAGLVHFLGRLDSGASREDIVRTLWNTPEHRGIQVDGYFQLFLNRSPAPAGRNAWINKMVSGTAEEQIMQDFLLLPEYQQTHATNQAFVTGVFLTILGRTPTTNGLNNWVAVLQNGSTRGDVANDLIESRERHLKIVDDYFLEFLNRIPKTSGRNFWAGRLDSGELNEADVAIMLMATDEYYQNAQSI